MGRLLRRRDPPRELSQSWRDYLAFIALRRKSARANRRQTPGRCHLRPTFEHQRWIGPHYRLHCGSDSAPRVLCRLLLLPQGPISTARPCRRRPGVCTRTAPNLVLFACTPAGQGAINEIGVDFRLLLFVSSTITCFLRYATRNRRPYTASVRFRRSVAHRAARRWRWSTRPKVARKRHPARLTGSPR